MFKINQFVTTLTSVVHSINRWVKYNDARSLFIFANGKGKLPQRLAYTGDDGATVYHTTVNTDRKVEAYLSC